MNVVNDLTISACGGRGAHLRCAKEEGRCPALRAPRSCMAKMKLGDEL